MELEKEKSISSGKRTLLFYYVFVRCVNAHSVNYIYMMKHYCILAHQ